MREIISSASERLLAAAGVVALLLLPLAGCAHLPASAPLPPGVSVNAVTSVDRDAPFAWAPSGDRIALARGALRLVDPAGTREVKIWDEPPVALAWSPDGSRLAAAFHREGGSAIRLFDPATGALKSEARVAGRVSSVAWTSGGELLAAAMEVKAYSFGGNVRQYLHRWRGTGAPVALPLAETTVKPLTLRQAGGALYRAFRLALSPDGDEILYTRLHDPPAFPPYLQVVLRHLATGAERDVGVVGLVSGGGVFAGDGEEVLYGDGKGTTYRLDPWQGRELATYSVAGASLAISAGGGHLLADGRLLDNGRLVAAFPADCAGLFAPGGERLLVRYGNMLYLVAGLGREEIATPGPAVRERLILLRKWRSQGIISGDEYRSSKERIINE